MIVVVEGPSAVGKTTWTQVHAGEAVVQEEPPSHRPPDGAEEAAAFWAANGAARWARALEVERASGIAVCDTDPLKLHYSWSLMRVGAGSWADFWLQATAYRAMVANRSIGFADLYLVSIPDTTTLARQRQGDRSRNRRNFDVNSRLGAPLREWYAAIEEVRSGSVVWEFTSKPIDQAAGRGGRERYDLAAFDALLDRLRVPARE